jgi:class 3 adenylate cyclase/tetratricopeptide (TPR) repeat protein
MREPFAEARKVTGLPSGTVTFLFTDIEGSTRLLKRLGDRYADALADHHRLLHVAFAEHSGQVVDTQGDAFFVAFPRARDAVEAAVAAQRALATHRWPEGAELRVRMGIHTGEPTVGAERYVGLGVHRAARISSIGHGGQVLLSNATRELLEEELPAGVGLRDLGEHHLKDLQRPERIFQLVVDGLPHQFPPLKAEPRTAAPLVGRERELVDLEASLEEALSGRGCVVLLAGEPGIGKSRLADELAGRARDRGARVLSGRCWEAGGAPAYWPWVQSIRSYVHEVEPERVRAELGAGAAIIAQMLPELRGLFPDLPEPTPVESEEARFRLFDAAAAFLRNAASRRPLVLLLDDLHAADVPSLLLLQFVAGDLRGTPILVLGTYRDIELDRDHPLRRTLAELARAPAARTLSLGGLPEPEVAQLIETITGQVPREAVARAIHGETEGNPLFVTEVVRLLASEGVLNEVGEGAARRIVLPDSVREVIGRRLSLLSPECAEVLTLASVLGRDFSLDALELLSDRSPDELLDVLESGIAARLVTEVPGSLGRLRFAHALVRDVLYADVSTLRRIRLHRRAAEVLERLYERDLDPHLAELAHHFFEAVPGGEIDKAIEYARRAGDRAVALTAFEEAVRLYRMALQALELEDRPEEDLRCELLLRLGEAQARAGETSAARETFLAAAGVARKLERPEQFGRAALGYGGRFVWEAGRGDPHLVPLLEEAVAALPVDSPLRAKLLARLAGGPLRDEVERSRRDALSKEAVEIAGRLGDPGTLAYVLDGRHAAAWWPENLNARLDIATQLVRVATQADDKERILQGHHYRFIGLLELGDMAGARAEVEAQARLAEELHQPTQLFYVATCRSTLAAFEGRSDDAERLTDEAFRYGERAERAMAVISRRFQLYIVRGAQGRLDELAEEIDLAVDEFPTYVVFRCMLAHLYAEIGRLGEAREPFKRLAASGFSELPKNDEWVFGMALLADVAGLLRDVPASQLLYEQLLPYDGRNAVSAPDACIGSVARSLGVLAATIGRYDDAARHFKDAIAMNTRTGGRPWVAQAQCNYARMLLERGDRGDHDRAVELVTACRETARALGSAGLLSKAEALEM